MPQSIRPFGTAYHNVAPHEFLEVQFLYCAFGLVGCLHLHEPEALRLIRVLVPDNFDRHHFSALAEDLSEVILVRVEIEIPDVDTVGRDFLCFWFYWRDGNRLCGLGHFRVFQAVRDRKWILVHMRRLVSSKKPIDQSCAESQCPPETGMCHRQGIGRVFSEARKSCLLRVPFSNRVPFALADYEEFMFIFEVFSLTESVNLIHWSWPFNDVTISAKIAPPNIHVVSPVDRRGQV